MKREYYFKLKLKEVLIKRGITQTELSERTGLRQATISDMVNDTRNVYNKKHLAIVMDALNIIHLDDILELTVIEK